jgi:hypothetical protein
VERAAVYTSFIAESLDEAVDWILGHSNN